MPTFQPAIGNYVGAVYDRKAYIGMVNDMDEEEVEIYFLLHNGRLNRQIAVILCLVPEPTTTK